MATRKQPKHQPTSDAQAAGEVRPGRGRPTKLTDEVIKLMVNARRSGVPDWQAAHFAEVSTRSYTDWKLQGAQDVSDGKDTVYSRLVLGLEKAKADQIAASLVRINQAARGGTVLEETVVSTTNPDGTITTTTKRKLAQPLWTADAWLCERTQPDDFGRTVVHQEVTGKEGGPVAVVVDSWAGIAKLAEGAKKA